MNKIKLPSMVEYVKLMEHKRLKTFITETKVLGYDKNLKFANFLSQEPNVGMVVAAVFEDGEWRILTKPIRPWQDSIIEEGLHQMYKEDLHQYQTALDNVIFEGFEVDYINTEIGNKFFRIKFDKLYITFYEDFISTSLPFKDTTIIKNLEQLTHYNLTLTPKFAKELGLI
jgi:hypothetical protein